MTANSVFKLSFYLLLFTLFILPLPIGSNRPWAWSIFEILIAVTSLLTVISTSPKTLYAPFKHILPILVPILLLQVWTIAQILHLNGGSISNDINQSEISLLKGLSYLLFIACCAWHLTDKNKVTTFCYTLISAAVFQALYATYLQYSGESHSPVFGMQLLNRATGSFVYQNHLANYLLIGVSLTIGFLISQLTRKNKSANLKRQLMSVFDALLSSKWLIRVSIICIVVALILTRSRMGNAAFFVSLVATSLLALWLMKHPPRVLKWLVLSFIVLDIAIVGALFGIEKVKERVDSTSFQSETRDDVVALSIPLIQDEWLTGTGAGTFYTAFPQV
ncbi:O-antigen ligase, partial [uncultured Alteromonas sp.]|uniref:O-antigen ligase family protein n=1 Tax=uncultured Alteromonas sp. TaxID=179113 RepID=UPI0025DB4A8D